MTRLWHLLATYTIYNIYIRCQLLPLHAVEYIGSWEVQPNRAREEPSRGLRHSHKRFVYGIRRSVPESSHASAVYTWQTQRNEVGLLEPNTRGGHITGLGVGFCPNFGALLLGTESPF